jgi:hypothetical protein
MKTKLGWLALGALGLSLGAGCGGGGADPGPPPADLRVDGTYEIVSSYDLTVGSVLPDPVASYAQTLVGLKKDPAGTFFQLLDQAGVPLASDLLDALPGPARDQLKGWMNDFIASETFNNAKIGAELDMMAAAAQTVLAKPDVASELTVSPPDARGDTTVTHTLRELRYHLYDGALDVTAPITAPPGSAQVLTTTASTPSRVTAARAESDGDAHLDVGNHAFGVAYGTYALAALEQAFQIRYGVDVRGALGLLVDCDAMAADVAGRCLLGACVGHQDDLAGVCRAGLDYAAQDLRDRIAGLRFDALTLQQGDAAIWDAPAPGGPTDRRIDRLDAGTWNASIDFGAGARAVQGTFVGSVAAR